MANTIFPGGIRCFSKGPNSPDYVMANVVITPQEFYDWLKGDGAQYLTEYNGKKQLRLSMLANNKGPYIKVDTFVPKKKDQPPDQEPKKKHTLPPDFDPIQQPVNDDLPF